MQLHVDFLAVASCVQLDAFIYRTVGKFCMVQTFAVFTDGTVGNFCMVQTFAVFADTTAKMKTANV